MHFIIEPEVASVLADGGAVVALESTLIAHGLPHPRGVETAMKAEAVIRSLGAVPATIAILDGKVRVGLSLELIERLATQPDVEKQSSRGLAGAIALGRSAATTVAATMFIANRAGIRVFATGGIGGVHRGETADISADLLELGRIGVAVVCAGAKSILDIGRTLEVLETQAVPVIGFGTDEFPAFYTRNSGFLVDRRVDSIAELANLIRIRWELGQQGGVVVANPIPEQDELDPGLADSAIEAALAEASRIGVTGKQLTPFLLERVRVLTDNASLSANVALILNNADVAARLAVELARS
ncbi:MAG: pseudouridine-5'-phosphate glycosidase [Gemmatimonadetes bacterium]|nr:MAG: pseudouridine-5'-phosphate glycosidase [Gemmatimonadota bacterium]